MLVVLYLCSMLMSHASVNFFVLSFVLPCAYAYAASEDQALQISLVDTCRKNRGWLLLADVIESILYLCKSSLLFVPYFSLFNIHSHTPEEENPRFLRQV